MSKPRKTRSPRKTRTTATASNPAPATPRAANRARLDQIAALHHARTDDDVYADAGIDRPAVDFEPLRNAACDAVLWALQIAEDDVKDWPEARQRVRRVRRALLDSIRGRRHLGASIEDAVFVTQLLVRIFEHDLGVDLGEVALLIEALGLPVDEVPIVRRPQRAARAPIQAPTPITVTPIRPIARTPARPIPRTPAPPPQIGDDEEECACFACTTGYRNAA